MDSTLSPDQDTQVNEWLKQQMAMRPGGDPATTPPAPADPEEDTSEPDAKDAHLTKQGNDQDLSKVEDSHPGHPADALAGYVADQEKQTDKYGPDQEKAVMDMIAKEQGSIPTRIGRGASALADGIMQGVAQQGNPGYLKSFDENQLNRQKMQAETVPMLQKMNMENLAAKQRLEGMDSATPLGASEGKAAMFFAKQLWPNMSPSQLAAIGQNPQALKGILPEGVDLKKALAEIENTAEFRKAQIAEQHAVLENTREHQKAEEQNAKTGRVEEAAKALASRGPVDKFLGVIPGTTSHDVKKVLENLMAGDQGNEVERTTKDGKTAIFDANTKKFLRYK